MDPNNNSNENPQENGNSTVSNLPILFANGYPTSLEKMSENQLEVFVPFLIKCSSSPRFEDDETDDTPIWWPDDLEYTTPFTKPKNFKGDWEQKMKDIVEKCYHHHNCYFLLKYSSDLSDHEPEHLRFVNDNNSTTSLYNRVSKKLLLTFRNENMLYDKKDEGSRKCLLPKRWNSAGQNAQMADSNMICSSVMDIWLCDNCDAELYSEEAYIEHEKSCYITISDSEEEMGEGDEEVMDQQTRESRKVNDFLLNFGLQSVNNQPNDNSRLNAGSSSHDILMSPEKLKRYSHRARNTISLSKCHPIPFSSPYGIVLLKKLKTSMNSDYQAERLDRIERFCAGPIIDKNNKPKWLKNNTFNGTNNPGSSTTITRSGSSQNNTFLSYGGPLYFKSRTCDYRNYKFPRRQYMSRSRYINFMFLNKHLLGSMKHCSIQLKNLNDEEIAELVRREKHRAEMHRQRKRELERKRIEKMSVMDVIDLCSSDGENDDADNENENLLVSSSAEVPPILDLPEPPANRIDGSFLYGSIPMETDGGFTTSATTTTTTAIRRNVLADFENTANVSALAGATSPKPQQQTTTTSILRQSTFLFSNTRTNYRDTTATVFTVNQESMTTSKRSQINDWLQSISINQGENYQKKLVKLN